MYNLLILWHIINCKLHKYLMFYLAKLIDFRKCMLILNYSYSEHARKYYRYKKEV